MDYFDEFNFSAPKRNRRSLKTLEDVVQNLEKLAQSGELTEVKIQKLSEEAGYAKSTIFHHFKQYF